MSAAKLGEAHTARLGPLMNIPSLLGELGCNADEVLRRAGVRRHLFSNPENRISYVQGGHLFDECVKTSGCDHFGLLLGQRACPSHLGIAGFLAGSAVTVGDALRALEAYLDLHEEAGTFKLLIEPEYSNVEYCIHEPGVIAIDQIYDLSATVIYQVFRALCGNGWVASEVRLVRQRPSDPLPFTKFFRTTIFYDSLCCGVAFPTSILEQESLMADEMLFRHLEEEAEMLHHLRPPELADIVPAMLQRGLLNRHFTAEDIALSFGMHERTFHRRLREAGTSFRGELDRVRESLSRQLLECTSLPVLDIATSLGYADSSGFIRAFRRWTGYSPTGWRKKYSLH